MGIARIYKFIATLLLSASVAMIVLLYITWQGVREENIQINLDESKLIYQRDYLTKEKAYKEEYYSRLINDDAFAERIIRQRWGFIGKGEMIFRFKDSTPISVDANATPAPTANRVNKTPLAHSQNTSDNVAAKEQYATPSDDNLSILARLFSESSTSEPVNVSVDTQTTVISLADRLEDIAVQDLTIEHQSPISAEPATENIEETKKNVLPVSTSKPSITPPIKPVNKSNYPNMIIFD